MCSSSKPQKSDGKTTFIEPKLQTSLESSERAPNYKWLFSGYKALLA
jgi:hypothetical protein